MDADTKKIQLILATTLLMFGLAIILAAIVPTFGFWEGAGIFLIGTGVVSGAIQLFVGEKGPIGFSLFLTIAGLFLMVKACLGTVLPDFGTLFWIGIALMIIAIGAIISIVLKK